MTEVVYAKLSNAGVSPQKVRLVLQEIRKKSVEDAVIKLSYMTCKSAPIVRKLLESAIANAENNNDLDPDELKVIEAFADQGVVGYRRRPESRGRGFRQCRRKSHITIGIGPKAEREA